MVVELVPAPSRPRPILDAIRSGAWVSVAGALITAAVAFGVLNVEQGHAVELIVSALVGVLAAGTSTLHAFHVLHRAEPEVTPVADPQDNLGRRLVPEDQPLP